MPAKCMYADQFVLDSYPRRGVQERLRSQVRLNIPARSSMQRFDLILTRGPNRRVLRLDGCTKGWT